MYRPSKIDDARFLGHRVFIKRDDQLSLYLSGNKFRKLFFLLDQDLSIFSRIVSYGGSNSNAMLSIASLAHTKKVPFDYYVRYLSNAIDETQGNLFHARKLGMQLKVKEASSDDDLGAMLVELIDEKSLFIKQGGALREAEVGVFILADEIMQWVKDDQIKDLKVALPSGTGTTALFLQKCLGPIAEVLTTACVGDSSYLKKQFERLEEDRSLWPTILTSNLRYPFAKPHKDLLYWYEFFKEQKIEFDLIYAPVMWQVLKENEDYWKESTLLYVHSGGVLGNATQRRRYES